LIVKNPTELAQIDKPTIKENFIGIEKMHIPSPFAFITILDEKAFWGSPIKVSIFVDRDCNGTKRILVSQDIPNELRQYVALFEYKKLLIETMIAQKPKCLVNLAKHILKIVPLSVRRSFISFMKDKYLINQLDYYMHNDQGQFVNALAMTRNEFEKHKQTIPKITATHSPKEDLRPDWMIQGEKEIFQLLYNGRKYQCTVVKNSYWPDNEISYCTYAFDQKGKIHFAVSDVITQEHKNILASLSVGYYLTERYDEALECILVPLSKLTKKKCLPIILEMFGNIYEKYMYSIDTDFKKQIANCLVKINEELLKLKQ